MTLFLMIGKLYVTSMTQESPESFDFWGNGTIYNRVWNKNRILNALNVLYQTERECKTSDLPAEQIASFAIIRISNGVKKFR